MRGFSLLELLVAMAITTTSAGALLSLVVAGQSIARVQPESADLQQRGRIATQVLATELSRAGAGPDAGVLAGPLAAYFAPVSSSPDGGVTIWYVSGPAQGTLTTPLGVGDVGVSVALDAACASASCGFAANTTAVIFDNSGCHDLARIDAVAPAGLVLHAAPTRACAYGAGAAIAQGEVRTFRVDPVARQLVRRDEATGVSVPISDNVAAMTVDYPSDGRVRVTLRFVAALLRQVPDLVVSLDARPPNLQAR